MGWAMPQAMCAKIYSIDVNDFVIASPAEFLDLQFCDIGPDPNYEVRSERCPSAHGRTFLKPAPWFGSDTIQKSAYLVQMGQVPGILCFGIYQL